MDVLGTNVNRNDSYLRRLEAAKRTEPHVVTYTQSQDQEEHPSVEFYHMDETKGFLLFVNSNVDWGLYNFGTFKVQMDPIDTIRKLHQSF